jgi:peptide methionine sulfoxide reductase msrA/msrB
MMKTTGKILKSWLIMVAIVTALILIAVLSWPINSAEENNMTNKKLTPEEERVIIHKGTEPPFSGKYYKFSEKGTFVCRQCGASLYHSSDKFDSECGWPSFDDAIPGAVKRTLDADGIRTEITCAKCGAHLGHVFEGEKLTSKDTRYCVNSISMDFIPDSQQVKTDTAYFAGGCFWGTQYLLKEMPGVISTRVGYMGGHTKNPTYQQVCYENTGHAETVEIVFDPAKTSYETLAKFFFEIHDPTQLDRQGPDVGDQYRSAVFYKNDSQKEIALKLIDILKKKGYKVVTEVTKADTFWEAEKYHQDYYEYTGKKPYCHIWQKKFD